MSNNILETPTAILKRELEVIKRRMEAMERSIQVTEKVMLEMVSKHNDMKDHLIKLTTTVSQLEPKKKRIPTKTPSNEK